MLTARKLPASRPAYACNRPRAARRRPSRIRAQQRNDSSDLKPHSSESVDGDRPAATEEPKTASYYAGLLTNDLQQDNRASSSDMLLRSLQLAGGVAGLLAVLVVLFLASNGLLAPPQQLLLLP